MPHRILASSASICIETILLGLVAGWHGMLAVTEFISEKDWARLLGEDGFKAALLIGLVVVWSNSEKSKQQRHKELVEALAIRDKEDSSRIDQFIELTEKVGNWQSHVARAIQSVDSNTQRLTLEVKELADEIRDRNAA